MEAEWNFEDTFPSRNAAAEIVKKALFRPIFNRASF